MMFGDRTHAGDGAILFPDDDVVVVCVVGFVVAIDVGCCVVGVAVLIVYAGVEVGVFVGGVHCDYGVGVPADVAVIVDVAVGVCAYVACIVVRV